MKKLNLFLTIITLAFVSCIGPDHADSINMKRCLYLNCYSTDFIEDYFHNYYKRHPSDEDELILDPTPCFFHKCLKDNPSVLFTSNMNMEKEFTNWVFD